MIAAAMLLAACTSHPALHPSHWHMPWQRAAATAPVPVAELGLEADGSNPLPSVVQYWNRNTLHVELGAVTGTGSFRLLPSAVNGWPMRIEIAVQPGSMNQLQVRGDQRVVFNVTTSAVGGLQVLQLGSGVYSAKTPAITVSWE